MHFMQPHHLRNVSAETIDHVKTYFQQEDHFFDCQALIYWLNIDATISESDQEKFTATVFSFYCNSCLISMKWSIYARNLLNLNTLAIICQLTQDAIFSECDDGLIEYGMDTIWFIFQNCKVWLEIMIFFFCFLNVH